MKENYRVPITLVLQVLPETAIQTVSGDHDPLGYEDL